MSNKFSNLTAEGVEVRVGQVWQDLDRRYGDRQRKVVSITKGIAMMGTTHTGADPFPVTVKRMHNCSYGWKLIKDVA